MALMKHLAEEKVGTGHVNKEMHTVMLAGQHYRHTVDIYITHGMSSFLLETVFSIPNMHMEIQA
jgi:hypothetical protein